MLNGRAFTVVGVAREGFHGTEPFLNLDFWVPLMMQKTVTGNERLAARGDHWLEVLVRLKPGVTLARAQSDLSVVERGIAAKFPKQSFDGIKLWELWRAPSMGGGAVGAVMAMQLAVAGVVLLIACANVANLLLVRTSQRERELAVRAALGGNRGALLRPGEEGYDEARRVWNGAIDRRPALIARCAGADDVAEAVGFAHERDLLVAVKGGGHAVAGHAVCDGGVMIDLSLMKAIRVDPAGRTARAAGGVLWGELDRATQAAGLKSNFGTMCKPLHAGTASEHGLRAAEVGV